MVCLSYNGTLKVVDRLCEDHDIEVMFWNDELKSKLDERTVSSASVLQGITVLIMVLILAYI